MSFRKQYETWSEKYGHMDSDWEEYVPFYLDTKGADMDVLETEYKKQRAAELRMDLRLGTINLTKKLPKLNKLYDKNMITKKKIQDFFLITINPKPDTDFGEFFDLVIGFANYKWSEKGYIFFEQRGETEDTAGYLPHAHIVIEKHSIERKRLITTCERIFSAVCQPPYVNTINVKNKKYEWLHDTLQEYLIEQNKDSEKLQKVEIDAVWRNKMNLENSYSWDKPNVCLTIDKRHTIRHGGPRVGSGVKKGDKRGKYKPKPKPKKNEVEEIKISTPEQKFENIILEF